MVDLKAAVSQAYAERRLPMWLASSVTDQPGPAVDAVCDALVELPNLGLSDAIEALLVLLHHRRRVERLVAGLDAAGSQPAGT